MKKIKNQIVYLLKPKKKKKRKVIQKANQNIKVLLKNPNQKTIQTKLI